MTEGRIREVVNIYRKYFEANGIPKAEVPHDSFPTFNDDCFAHLHDMLDQMEIFLKEGRLDKVFRWLGFIQGVLWIMGVYTVEELKDHNRPPDSFRLQRSHESLNDGRGEKMKTQLKDVVRELFRNPAETQQAASEWLLLYCIRRFKKKGAKIGEIEDALAESVECVHLKNEKFYLMWPYGYDLDDLLHRFAEVGIVEEGLDEKSIQPFWRISQRGKTLLKKRADLGRYLGIRAR